jgi:hypothetical protein
MVPIGMPVNGIALPGFTSTLAPATTLSPGTQPLRGEDIGLLAILIAQKRDEGRPVRVVFDAFDRGRDIVFRALEIDDAVKPLRPAAAAPRGDPSGVVPAARFRQPLGEGLHGRPFQSSERSISTSPRWPGVVGLYDLSAMLPVFRLPWDLAVRFHQSSAVGPGPYNPVDTSIVLPSSSVT